MKRATISLLVCTALTIVVSHAAFGGGDQPTQIPPGTVLKVLHPLVGAASNAPASGSAAPASAPNIGAAGSLSSSLPLWSYHVVSPVDGNAYTGQMVGTSPLERPESLTVVPTVLIPVALTFAYQAGPSIPFDPSAADDSCIGPGNTALSLTQQSPLFNNFDYNLDGVDVGKTQYLDAFQRANFWQDIPGGRNRYHTLLALATLPEQAITVPSASVGNPAGTVYIASNQCGNGLLGVMNVNWWDRRAHRILRKLGVQPAYFAIFIFYNAAMSAGNPTNLNNCCVLGYHNSLGAAMQTYAVADFEGRNQTLFLGTSDVSDLSHEVGEWMDDPAGSNPTPAWGNIGQVQGCQNNLEVGDPLTSTVFPPVTMPNGFTYHLQELAFFSWFFRQDPSIGVNGWFSNDGTFTMDAGPVCQ